MRKGAVLVSFIGNLGKVGIAGVALATNQQINAIEFNPMIVDDRYGYYYTKILKEWMEAEASATTVTILNKGRFSKAPFLLPPLAEQQRIADKLDSLLARVDACRATLERLPGILRRFCQAVLTAATAGRLTEEWREENPELASTKELLTQLGQRAPKNPHKQRRADDEMRFDKSALPPHWLYIPVDFVGEVFLGRQRSPENHTGPYMRQYMWAANVTWRGWDFTDVKEMNFDPNDFARYRLQVGDVLINEGSGSADEVGKPAIWQGDIEDCCFQNTLICVRPHERMSEYLYFVFLHAALSKSFVEDTRGVNIFHIGKERFSAFLIPLPSLAEQREIVRRVELLFAFADRLAARLAAARAQVEQLTPSLLAKAFRGELA